MAEIVEIPPASHQALDDPIETPSRTASGPFPETGEASEPPSERRPLVQREDLYVLFTTADATLAALRVAAALAQPLHSTIRLIDFRVVPVGAPVDAPTGRSPIEIDGFLDRVRAEGIPLHVNVYVCRNMASACSLVFKPNSMVLIGGRRHWWTTRAERWRRMLERRGHFVLLIERDNDR